MSLILSEIVKKIDLITKAGQYLAVLNIIAFLGTQKTPYGEDIQMLFGFTTDKSEVIYKTYSVNLAKDCTFNNDLKNICGNQDYLQKGFDLFSLLGSKVLLDVEIKSNENKSYPVIKLILKTEEQFDVDDVEYITFSFKKPNHIDKLPYWISNNIRKSKEWKLMHSNYS